MSKPAAIEEPEPIEPEIIEDDVWTLLARGESGKARQYFLGEVDVNARDRFGRTPLHIAAENMDPVLAAFFISLGADVNALDSENRTPLAISADKRDAPTARVLVSSSADIHFPMKGDTSPARIAVTRSETRNNGFLEALLNPVSVYNVDTSGRTILHLAAEAGNARAVDTILKTGNTISITNDEGKTALDIALERTDSRNHARTAERLILAGAVSENPLFAVVAPAIRSSNYNIRFADGSAPLHYIALQGYRGYLQYFIDKKADVNIKNASGASPLHEAARSGNVASMETLLENGAEINAQDAKGNSVLHMAIPREFHPEAVRLFLSHGANPDLRDEHGDSSLHVAIMLNRQEEILASLLAAGADVTIRDIDGKTPLSLAVEKQRINYIPLLLAYKSDIFASDNQGKNPFEKALTGNINLVYSMITDESVLKNDSAGNTMLHLTVNSGGDTQVLEYILNHGAQVNARNQDGDTSLTIAVRRNDEEAGKLLLENGADIFAVNARNESPLYLTFPPSGDGSGLRRWMLNSQTLNARDGLGYTALHYAAAWRMDSWIPLLIEMGANTEAANATGETPLFTAIRINSTSTIYVLIANGASLYARDTLGNSLLHAAVRWQALQSAEAVIDLGLDVNSHALNGKTPLHDSIRYGMYDIEVMLLSRGADIEIRDAEGNSAFMEAVFAGNPSIMEQLAEMGADPNTRNFAGDTPLHITALTDRPDLAAMLLGWGASIHAKNARGRTPFQNAVLSSPRQVSTFLTKDRIHTPDDNGFSPLHIAISEHAPQETLKTILDLGGRLSTVDASGRTPLRLAVDLRLWDTARFLVDSGADVFTAARDGNTSADISLAEGLPGINALFSGSAITAKDQSGNTILHYAARRGDVSSIIQLLSMGAQKEVKNIAAETPREIAVRWSHPEAAALLN